MHYKKAIPERLSLSRLDFDAKSLSNMLSNLNILTHGVSSVVHTGYFFEGYITSLIGTESAISSQNVQLINPTQPRPAAAATCDTGWLRSKSLLLRSSALFQLSLDSVFAAETLDGAYHDEDVSDRSGPDSDVSTVIRVRGLNGLKFHSIGNSGLTDRNRGLFGAGPVKKML